MLEISFFGVFDEERKKRLLRKGNTLTRVETVTIGKSYENTKIEVKSVVQIDLLQKRT